MNIITKGFVGTVAAGAMALSSASPALARDNRGGHHDGISAGDVIAGALIIGGIAAIASAASSHNDRYERYDSRYNGGYYGQRENNDGYNYGYQANPRQAVELCVNEATRHASRYSYGGRANVTDIRDISRNSDGFTVRGRITVNSGGHYNRSGDYYRGRGWNDNYRGVDSGSFKCKVRYGRVVDLDFSGIRGL